jgi:HK97 family phage major capsid protein
VQEIKLASENIRKSDEANRDKLEAIEQSINDLYKKVGRPGGYADDNETDARKSAIGLCQIHKSLVAEGDVNTADYVPSSSEVQAAMRARQGLKALFRTGHIDRLDPEYRKSLSSFSFGNNGFLLAPEMSNRVLRCIVDPTDLSGLMDSIAISSPSVRFLIDNARMFLAAWSCESNCFANNPQPDLQEGLGEMDIKPETIRFVVCVTRDLLEDASIDIEAWILRKASKGMAATINAAILLGDGIGKPTGLLAPQSGIPICEVSPATAPGQFSWQDLLMLRYEIPMTWQDGCSYLMNQRTFALLQTMSSAEGRPLFGPMGTNTPRTGFQFGGAPINIVSQMPDVAPGSPRWHTAIGRGRISLSGEKIRR